MHAHVGDGDVVLAENNVSAAGLIPLPELTYE